MKNSITTTGLLLLTIAAVSCSGNEAKSISPAQKKELSRKETNNAESVEPAQTPPASITTESASRRETFIPPVVVDAPAPSLPEITDDQMGSFASRSDEGFGYPSPVEMPVSERYEQGPETIVDVQAEFPGGKEGLTNYLKANLVYPKSAIEADIQGKCFIRFVVSKSGDLSQFIIAKKVPGCPECDAEALRVMKAGGVCAGSTLSALLVSLRDSSFF